MSIVLTIKAMYFGIEVELLCQLNHYLLVRFNGRPYVVDMADLVLEQDIKETARVANKSRAA